MKPAALYLHIPFCLRKCHYCDFVVRVLQRSEQIDRYLEALEHELVRLSREASVLKTLYLGGGTPALLSPTQIENLSRSLAVFELAPDAEVTLEVNPEALDLKQIEAWKTLGVNRVSLGVQSFLDHELALMGRSHRRDDIERTLALLRGVGLDNISFDLIYGLPNHQFADWQASLEAALRLGPSHLSLYALEIHEKTLFGHRQLESSEEAIAQYEWACEFLASAGYQHYEIANWCLPDRGSQHNQVYWKSDPYLAAGVGAHGYFGKRRYANPARLRDYYAMVEKGEWAFEAAPEQSHSEALEEYVFTGLRLLEEGIDLQAFEARFKRSFWKCYPAARDWITQGKLLYQAPVLKLSPESVFFSNALFMEFLDPVLD